jgi:AraC-like DNA-binding protein
MRRTGTRTLASMRQSSSPLVMHPRQEDPLDGRLLQICEAFSEQHSPEIAAPRLRRRAFNQAIAIIHDRAHEPVTITELYRLSGASGRTLRYSFEDALGMSPRSLLIYYLPLGAGRRPRQKGHLRGLPQGKRLPRRQDTLLVQYSTSPTLV